MVRVQHAVGGFATAMVVLWLQGCALVDPNIRYDDKPLDEVGKPGNLAQERQRGYRFVRRLEDAASQHSQLRSGVALTVIPMTAVATYKGLASSGNGTTKLITKLAVGAATIFGLGDAFYSTDRKRVYFEGARAASCILSTTGAYHFLDTDPFPAAQSKLVRAIGRVNDARGALTSAMEEARRHAVPVQSAATTLREADTSLDHADATRKAGVRFAVWSDNAGSILYDRMYALAIEIDKEVDKTEPDILSLHATLANITKTGPSGALPTPPAAPTPSTAPQRTGGATESERMEALSESRGGSREARSAAKARLDDSRTNLASGLRELGDADGAVVSILEKAQAASQDAAAASCAFNPAASTFAVFPSGTSFPIAANESKEFTVIGGTGTIRATVAGPKPDVVEATVSITNGFTVVTAKAGAQPPDGDYSLLIMDGTESHRVVITLKVAKTH